MTIKEKLKADMIAAMKSKEKERLDTIRFVQAAVKRVEVDTRKDLDDAALIGILSNLSKQRKDSIEQFRKGGREDLATKEEAELKILQSYMPEQMSASELEAIVVAAIQESGAQTPREMGVVMKLVMAKTAGRAEGSAISDMVKKKLTP